MELLPRLSGVRYLWVESKVTQEFFDTVCSMRELEGLSLHWNQASDLGRLVQMEGLRHLHLGNSSTAESIEPLHRMTGLKTLSVSNLRRVRDLTPLAHLKQLEELQVDGGMWQTQRVASLGPLGGLTNLRRLSLTNLRSDDRTLAPLFALSRLEYFASAQWWDPAELAEIRRRNPDLAPD